MRVSFHKQFDRSFSGLPEKTKQQFKKRLKLFLENPFNPILNNHSLAGDWKDYRSINITGDYRAIFVLMTDDEAVFCRIGTHSELYG